MPQNNEPQPLFSAQRGTRAAPFEVVGVNGAANINIPSVNAPAIPDISIRDETAGFMARQNESVNNAFDYSAQVISQNQQGASAEAATRTQSNFGQTVAGLVGAVQSGIEVYHGVKQMQAEKAAADQQALNDQLGAELEQRVRENMIELQQAWGRNAMSEGLIPTYTAGMREMRAEFVRRGMSPEIAQQFINMGLEQINEVAKQQGVRMQSETEDARAAVLEQSRYQLELQLAEPLQNLTHRSITGNTGETMGQVNTIINNFLSEGNVTGMDALLVVNGVYPKVIGALEAAGANTAQFVQQQEVLSAALSQAMQINQQYSGNAEQRNYMFAQLQATIAATGLDVQLSDIFQTDVQKYQQQMALQSDYQSLQNAMQNGPQQMNQQQSRAQGILAAQTALEWIINPRANAIAIENGSTQSGSILERGAYRLYTEFQEDRTRMEESDRRIAEIATESAQIMADLQTVARKLDPTGALGQPTVQAQWINQLIELEGTERGSLSIEEARALERVQEYAQADLTLERDQLVNEKMRIISQWQESGIDILDPGNLEFMEPLASQAEEIIRQSQQYQQPPPNTPASFLPGLPSLPQR
jgi:hypothetical protein